MSKNHIYENLWTIEIVRAGKVIFSIKDKKNLLCDEGEKAMVDTFFRDKASDYFSGDYFYIGLYKGTITESSILATIPNEPSGNGYSRQMIERSTVGFPTIEQNEGDWRVVSKEVTITASGGDIGPINGAFLGTTSDDSGVLIGAVAIGTERTIKSGDIATISIRIKQK